MGTKTETDLAGNLDLKNTAKVKNSAAPTDPGDLVNKAHFDLGGVPPGDHATEHEAGGGDTVDHDSLVGFVANEHLPKNDSGTSSAEVWSAQKVKAEVDALSSGNHRKTKVIDYVDGAVAPPTEVTGDRYILDGAVFVHGDWDGASPLDLVEYDVGTPGAWEAFTPSEGWIAYVDDEDADRQYVDDGVPAWESRPVTTNLHADLTDVSASQHHAKYTDPEAVSAMGAKADGNPLNHDRPVQATESAFGIGELATQTETDTGADDLRIVTPLKVRVAIEVLNNVVSETLLGDEDDYSPTGLSTAHVLRIDPGTGDREISGIAAQGSGRKIYHLNAGTDKNLKLKNESSLSLAANRFALKADLTLEKYESVILWYDGTSSRWRVVGANI